MDIVIVSGSEATELQLLSFTQLLRNGGQIKLTDEILAKQLRAAEKLAFAYEQDTFLGIGAIKNPQESYRKKVFGLAGIPDRKDNYTWEVGYFVTSPEAVGKGVCTTILYELIKSVLPVTTFFATTKSLPMKNVFAKFGFTKAGNSWSVDSKDDQLYELELFVHNQL